MTKPLRAVAALALAGASLTCTPSIPKYSVKYAEKRASLSENGLRLVIVPDKNTPMVHVAVRYEVGANEDPPGKAGLAHLVEHMMFQHRFLGPDKPPTFELIPQMATGFNAYTTWDQTHYYLDGRKEDLEAMLRLEAARMGAICNTIPPEQFERELDVVRNEIRQRQGTPEGQVPGLILAEAYPVGHAYHEMVGGNDQQLASIQFEDVCKFLEDYYTPDRATVIVAGNVDPDDVGKKVQYAFGGIPKRTAKPRKRVDEITEYKSRRVVKDIDLERSQLMVVWRLPPQTSDEWIGARAAIGVLGGRLAYFNRDYNFAASVGAFTGLGGQHAPIGIVVAELNEPDDANEALSWIWRAVKSVHRPFEEGQIEIDDVAVAKADLILNLETLDSRAGFIADQVQFRSDKVPFDSSQEYLFTELKELERLDPGKFRGYVKRTFRQDNALVLEFRSSRKGIKGDKRAARKYTAKTHDKEMTPVVDPMEAKRPLPAPETKSALSNAVHYQLGNGMKVVLLPYDAMPIITLRLVFDAGSAQEPADRAGLASIAAGYLWPPPDADFPKVGVGFFGYAEADHSEFWARGISIYDGVAIKGLERILKVSEHNQNAIEYWQKNTRKRFESERYRRNREFGQLMAKAIYGDEHPYAVTGAVTLNSIGRIGRDAAMGFKRSHFTAKNATLIVVGDFDVEQVKGHIAENFGEWGSGGADKPVPPTQRSRTGPEYFGVVDPTPQSPQMDVRIAYPAPAGVDGQEAARQVLVTMLNLRLAKIRSELGSTYGTYAARPPRIGPTAYVMGGGVDAARAGESLKAMRDKIDSLRRGDDFDRDFAIARRIVLKALLAEGGDTLALSERLAYLAKFDLPPDFYDQQIRFVAAVSPAQVKALIAQELRPELEIIGCMANREVLVKAFEEANIQVTIVEPK